MLKSIRNFFYDIKQEIKKISWVKKQDVFSSLLIVMVIIICFSFFFCFIDFLSVCIVKGLFGIIYDI